MDTPLCDYREALKGYGVPYMLNLNRRQCQATELVPVVAPSLKQSSSSASFVVCHYHTTQLIFLTKLHFCIFAVIKATLPVYVYMTLLLVDE